MFTSNLQILLLMRNTPLIPSKTLLSFFVVLILMSCTKDMDLILEYSVQEEEEIAQTTAEEGSEEPGSNDTPPDNPPNNPPNTTPNANRADDFVPCSAGEGSQYNPTSAADIQNAANAGRTAVITNSFDCDGCTFASGQTIIPSGGVISGTGINVNGACILDDFSQLFTSSVTFSSIYENSRLSPESFGANGFDSVADDLYLNTLINNTTYAIGNSGASYIKNVESVYNRSGYFDWNMNSSKVVTTNGSALSHGSSNSNEGKYLMYFNGLNPTIFNGEFDGNQLASRLFLVDFTSTYNFENLYIHNYYSPPSAYARCVAIKIHVRAQSPYNFEQGVIKDCLIENIGAASNGNANDTPYGVSKAIWVEQSGSDAANLFFTGNTINNIYGDDAEAFYNSVLWGGSYSHDASLVNYIFDDETYIGAQRRAMKITLSNASITNSTFESASNAPIFSGAQATLVHFFSTSGSGQALNDITFSNNIVNIVGNAGNNPIGFTDITNSTFENNTISCNYFGNTSYFGFGTGISNPYSGDISNSVVIQNNTFNNVFFQIESVYDPINGGATIGANTFNNSWNTNPGGYIGIVRLYKMSGSSPEFHFKNATINMDISNASGLGLFSGVFNTWGAEPKGWTFENITINYTGTSMGSLLYPFAFTGKNDTSADFDSTNSISNCTISGAIGTGAVFVKGADESVIITNSFGDGNTPITRQ